MAVALRMYVLLPQLVTVLGRAVGFACSESLCSFSLSILVFLITHICYGTCNPGIQFITSLGQQQKSITSRMSLKSIAIRQCPCVHVAKCGPVISMTQQLNFSHSPHSCFGTSGREARHSKGGGIRFGVETFSHLLPLSGLRRSLLWMLWRMGE